MENCQYLFLKKSKVFFGRHHVDRRPSKCHNQRKDVIKGGESNAKMHLVLTPDVFALRLDAAIFAYHIEKIMLKASENRKFRASKKPTVGFFAQGLHQ